MIICSQSWRPGFGLTADGRSFYLEVSDTCCQLMLPASANVSCLPRRLGPIAA